MKEFLVELTSMCTPMLKAPEKQDGMILNFTTVTTKLSTLSIVLNDFAKFSPATTNSTLFIAQL